MITTPTVLVLGAGASFHAGYPLGGQLVNDLCQQRRKVSDDDLPMNWTVEDADRFLTRLSRAGHYSIDAFLETVPDQAELGKFLMAREMKRHEDIDQLFPPNNPGWYQYLFNCLLDNNSASGFASSHLSVITFNYDRSLEAYLHETLMARFEMSSDDASFTLSQLRIVHVYGSLGHYPYIPYVTQCGTDELLEISRQIQIIHEVPDSNDGFCNREFEEANVLLNESERIFFLGFAFHPDNIRRFLFFAPDKTAGREIYATTYGMGPIEERALADRLGALGVNPRAALHPNTCNTFFTHVASLH